MPCQERSASLSSSRRAYTRSLNRGGGTLNRHLSPRLVAVTGPLEGGIFELVDLPYTLGREASNHLQLRQSSVSRRHAVIEQQGDHLVLRDLESRHGTFVNGLPVDEHRLEQRDFVKVGSSVFLFLLRPETEEESVGSVCMEDRDYVAESTVQISAGDTQKLWQQKLRASLKPSAGESHLKTLFEIATAIHSLGGVARLARRVMELVAEAVPAERVALWLEDEGEGELEAVHPAGRSVRLSRTTVERVMSEHQAVLCNDVLDTEAFEGAESLHEASIRSLVCAPLLVPERALGVLYADTKSPQARFTREHLELVTAVAAIAAVALDNARHVEWLEGENRRLRAGDVDHDMVGRSPALEHAFRFISRVAPTGSTVLLRGESGTGKELMALAIHRNSDRAERPFVAINCAALSPELLESELFGHERGAFTSAVRQKRGQFEVADGGTVLLDEVGEMPLALQAKLLRALEERKFQRVGGTREIQVDIRVIASTNRDLEKAIRQRVFRQDLYYRLNVLSFTMPPLRQRREDVPLLASHFAARFSDEHGRPVVGISPAALCCLGAYDWPGNVRELANAVECAVVLGQGDLLRPEDFPQAVLECQPAVGEPATYHEAVNEAKRRILHRALEESEGNVAAAARRLGLHRNYLHRLIKNLGLRDEP